MTFFRASIAGALALGLLSAAPAFADPPPASATTPTDTKPFGDWTVRCFPVKSPSPCDMFELLANKASGQRVMSVSIAYLPVNDKHVMQIAVPLLVAIQKGLVLSTDTYTSPVLHYRRCDRAGCYVEMLVDNDIINALSTSTGQAKVRIIAEGGKPFDIPFSLNGFSDAHGAMQDLARKKTAKPAEAPATPAPATPAPAATPTP
ncbi:MAG TPA: invasion associated locus B family protein [Rhizomicrobium sp.]|nr:invasion associated locus B family protein [Rhizomicrobium sp.]